MIIATLMMLSMAPQVDMSSNPQPTAETKSCKRITLPHQLGGKNTRICATAQEWAQYAQWQEAEYRRARRENFPISGL